MDASCVYSVCVVGGHPLASSPGSPSSMCTILVMTFDPTSEMGSKVITKIVRTEEGEPGDEASYPYTVSYIYRLMQNLMERSSLKYARKAVKSR